MHTNENRFKGGGAIFSLPPTLQFAKVGVVYILVSTVKVFDVTFINTQAPFFGALMMVQALK